MFILLHNFILVHSPPGAAGTSKLHPGVDEDEFHDALRPITNDDLIMSLNKMKESKLHTGSLHLAKLDMD